MRKLANYNTNQPILEIDRPIILFDGGSWENSNQGAAAAILLMPNGRRYTVSQLLSCSTVQEAEYTGLIIGLKKAKSLGIRSLEIKGDSESVFNQVNGFAPINNEKLRRLYQEVLKLMYEFEIVTLERIPKEQNRSARTAVTRCLEEALGKEIQPKKPPEQKVASSEIARLLQLGAQATVEDYQNLRVEADEWTLKPLSELSWLIPAHIQELMALSLQSNERDLAQAYRWYLRGLPPDMVIRKLKIDREGENQTLEKLLLEEPLLSLPDLEPPERVDDKAFEPPATTLETAASSLSLEPIDSESAALFLSPPNLKPPSIESEDLFSSWGQEQKTSVFSEDTLPSDVRVRQILEIVDTLTLEEKMILIGELVKFTEVVNLMLKAIADKMAGGNSPS